MTLMVITTTAICKTTHSEYSSLRLMNSVRQAVDDDGVNVQQ